MSKKDALSMPHDHAFKEAMSDLRVARDFFQHHLPEKYKSIVDFNTLKIKNGSFIDQELKESEVDILYQANFSFEESASKEGLIYLLAEQQTKPDRWMPFRLLRYICRILEQHRKQNPKEKCLPLVIPLVFYNGRRSYNYSLDLFSLFGEQEKIAAEILFGPYSLIDLAAIPDEEIRSHYWVGLMEMVMKHVHIRDAKMLIERWMLSVLEKLLSEENAESYIVSMINYTINQTEIKDTRGFFALMRKHLSTNKKVEDKIMTIAEQLRWDGMRRGIQQGVRQGVQQGANKIKEKMVNRLYKILKSKQKVAEYLDLSLKEVNTFLVKEKGKN